MEEQNLPTHETKLARREITEQGKTTLLWPGKTDAVVKATRERWLLMAQTEGIDPKGLAQNHSRESAKRLGGRAGSLMVTLAKDGRHRSKRTLVQSFL